MRRPTENDQSTVENFVVSGLRELAEGRGGPQYLEDLACFLNVAVSDLAASLTSEVMSGGIAVDGAIAVAIDGLALIYVDPDHRRSKLGSSLYHALRDDAEVEMWTKPGDRTAKSFAESLGLKARLLVMSAEKRPNDAP